MTKPGDNTVQANGGQTEILGHFTLRHARCQAGILLQEGEVALLGAHGQKLVLAMRVIGHETQQRDDYEAIPFGVAFPQCREEANRGPEDDGVFFRHSAFVREREGGFQDLMVRGEFESSLSS